MKKILLVLGIFSIIACQKVPAGHVGIKVHLLGTSKGVDHEELPVGRYWIGFNEELYLFPTFQQNYTWIETDPDGTDAEEGAFTFQSKEGLEATANIGISYHLDVSKITTIFEKYRRGIDEITNVFLRNNVRDALQHISSTMAIEALYGEGKTAFMDKVQQKVINSVADIGITIDKVYLVGSIKLPRTVRNALNLKIEATQRAEQRENELREAEAEAAKSLAIAEGKGQSQIALAKAQAEALIIEANAEAKANKIIGSSVSTSLTNYLKVKSWNGVLPKVTSNAIPLINVDTK